MRLVFDSESDHLKIEATTIWCICTHDIDTHERRQFGPDQIREGLDLLAAADEIIGHNIYNHDLPLFRKLYPEWEYTGKATDTFILSSLSKPDRKGGHSIENFGEMFGRSKPVHEDWSRYTPEMLHRCEEDVEINLLAYNYIMNEMKGWDWSRSVEGEYKIARVHAQQELNGVCFDAKQAWDTLEKLHDELEGLEEQLRLELPKRCSQPYKVPISRPFLISGDKAKSVWDWMGEETDLVSGPFSRVRFEDINLNSSEQVKQYLLSVGWVPTEWNYKKENGRTVKGPNGDPIKTSPKLTEDSFSSVQGRVPELITRYYVLDHRRSLIYNVRKRDGKHTGWLNELRSDGKITAGGIPQGTPTGRYRHYGIVNVPKNDKDVIYGKEMRELFIACPGFVMCGSDAKALENRIEGHYTAYYDGGEYAQSLLHGDPHTKNQIAFSNAIQKEISRPVAKSLKYALLYGAQPHKVATTAGVQEKYGKILYDTFWKANPALEALKRDVEAAYKKRGFLIGIDGRKLLIRSLHALLNTLFQSTGSIVVKKATTLLWEDWIPNTDITAYLVIHQHDEFQGLVAEKNISEYTELSLKSFVESGKHFKLNIPIEGDTKVGINWAETH